MAETPTTQRPLTDEADPGTADKDKQDTTVDPKGAGPGGRGADDEIEPRADR